ncbi:MAG TPA: hotdog domain-containing protein [Myxococcales bacterium]|nr:hotdog domain-containing protein [Myxococcales bacterium]
MAGLQKGATFKLRYTVTEADTAAALKPITGDDFPAVLATTRCIALLELVAGRLLKAECAPGQLSVGVVVDVTHLAATPVGAWVEAEATYVGREGKLYVFEVVARDPGGEIMRGRHQRAVIEESRLLAGAAKRR